MGKGGIIFSIYTGYIVIINTGENGYMYLVVVDNLNSLMIAVGCAIINLLTYRPSLINKKLKLFFHIPTYFSSYVGAFETSILPAFLKFNKL
jgi:hypothetical protein